MEIEPNSVITLNNRGVTYREMDRAIRRIVSRFYKLLGIEQNNVTGLINRGITYREMKRYEESLADTSKSLEIEPNNVDSLNNHGIVYQEN